MRHKKRPWQSHGRFRDFFNLNHTGTIKRVFFNILFSLKLISDYVQSKGVQTF